MKTNPRHGRAAFTLIELMAVITIIVILAALVVGSMGFVNERQAKAKANVQLGILAKALEDYKLDNGTYPPTANKTGSFTTNGTSTSAELYVALFYEGYDYAQQNSPANWTKKVNGVDVPKATKIYIPELNPINSKQGWTDPVTGTTPPASVPLKDPWGYQYCYRTATNNAGIANGGTQNPDFDLWSMGKNGKSSPDTPTSPDNRDDIKAN
jgi:prepilin-type N-terminal cleavage/methylation domain-containing protein